MSVAIPGSDRLIKVNYLTCKKMKYYINLKNKNYVGYGCFFVAKLNH